MPLQGLWPSPCWSCQIKCKSHCLHHEVGDKLDLLRSMFSMIYFAHNMLPTLASSISKGDLLMMYTGHTSAACLKNWALVCLWWDKTWGAPDATSSCETSDTWQNHPCDNSELKDPRSLLINMCFLKISLSFILQWWEQVQRVILGNSPKDTLHYLQVWEISITEYPLNLVMSHI